MKHHRMKHFVTTTGLFSLLPLVLLATLLSSACTKENWYEGIKASHEVQCRKEPISEYDACMKSLQEQSYKDYEQDRQSLPAAQ